MNRYWQSDFMVPYKDTGTINIQYLDLNPYAIKGYIAYVGKTLPRRSKEDYYNQYAGTHIDRELLILATSIRDYLTTYAIGGRLTIARSLHFFLWFQATNHFEIGSDDGVAEYCNILHSEIRKKSKSVCTVMGLLSTVNCFLRFCGKLERPINHSFGPKKSALNSSSQPLRKSELILTIQLLLKTYNGLRNHIEEQINLAECSNNSTHILAPMEKIWLHGRISIRIKKQKINYKFITCRLIRDFMWVSYYLFIFYTWGNKEQVLNLKPSEITFDEDSNTDSNFKFKGRAFTFVRLGIGKSLIDSDRAGYKWLQNFINLRTKLVKVYQKKNYTFETNKLFFNINKEKKITPLIIKTSLFRNGLLFRELVEQGYKVPEFNGPKLRKSAEQYADSILKNPLIITEKAQHTWGTYQKNYAKGNKFEALANVSKMLNTLIDGGVSSMTFSNRQQAAKNLNITLVKDITNDTPLLPNGFGCKRSAPTTQEEIIYIRQQNSFGRKPKACADLLSCVTCDKCAVIENEQAIYKLISFREMITLNKVTYIGSKVAVEKYNELIKKLDLRLALVDPKIVARANKKMINEGISSIWII
ncbi:hypothetical protein [uncultured Photobacterium sp.]|uniref:hypothetical protein n=1 Tax=uncultured Photobacterium sp. TaxID=173973 RepID=UPI002626B1C1|nr:hypothetical protein [uncultured Photobacterium sp.]